MFHEQAINFTRSASTSVLRQPGFVLIDFVGKDEHELSKFDYAGCEWKRCAALRVA